MKFQAVRFAKSSVIRYLLSLDIFEIPGTIAARSSQNFTDVNACHVLCHLHFHRLLGGTATVPHLFVTSEIVTAACFLSWLVVSFAVHA